jgi:SPOR domain/Tetratricopeptide repeat
MLGGCGENHPVAEAPQPSPELVAASQALTNHQPDLAISYAGSFLQNQPTGPLAAQALYFQGRGHEELVATSPADRDRNLVEARACYLLALQQSPAKPLEADIHTSLAIVDFFQDSFPDCIQEASVAMSLVPPGEVKGNLLLHTGLSEQRLGRFTDADQTFRQVEQQYPGTGIAESARQHEGRTKFYVQLATFKTPDAADQASQSLRSRNIVVSQSTDAAGHTIIDVGSFDTYTDAKKMLEQLQAEFPNAEIVP